MPYSGEHLVYSVAAAADLSSAQYRFITVDANGRGTISSANNVACMGILQNKPGAADRAAQIAIGGISKLKFGVAANEGAEICSNAEGYGTIAASAGDQVMALVLHAPGGSGDIQDVLLVHYEKV